MSSGTLRCDGHNGYKCIRGNLYEENLGNGTQELKGPCPICAGVMAVEPKKLVVQMPGTPVAAEMGLRQITNNVMGHVRTPINAKHEEHIQKMRDVALEFYVALHDAGGTDPNQDRFLNRNLAIAATNIEDALMHAVKGVCARK